MRESTFKFKSIDDVNIHVYKWEPDLNVNIRGVVQIVHGSVEHALRYKDFASFLIKAGFVVYANDHRGHGKSAKSIEELSYFSDLENGYELAIDDLYTLNQRIHMDYPNEKVIMLGHSLGSFMARKYVTKYQRSIDALILSGTGGGQNLLLNVGLMLAKIDLKIKGRKFNSMKLHNLMYAPLNKNVVNAKSGVDFISRDQLVIDEYNNDPYCGHTVTTEYARESLAGIKYCNSKESFRKTPKDLPIYITSGGMDLVGGANSKCVKQVHKNYSDAGIVDLEIKIYEKLRHEILNEVNKIEVYNDIVNWIGNRLN